MRKTTKINSRYYVIETNKKTTHTQMYLHDDYKNAVTKNKNENF